MPFPNEDDYWRDFYRGNSLEKYGDVLIKTFYIDRFQFSDLMIGVY